MFLAPLLAETTPSIPLDYLAYFVICIASMVWLLNQVKKLLGFDRPQNEISATRGELSTLSAQLALCATRTEMEALRLEVSDRTAKLEKYIHEKEHDTREVMQSVNAKIEAMQVNFFNAMNQSLERLDGKFERLDGKINNFLQNELIIRRGPRNS